MMTGVDRRGENDRLLKIENEDHFEKDYEIGS